MKGGGKETLIPAIMMGQFRSISGDIGWEETLPNSRPVNGTV